MNIEPLLDQWRETRRLTIEFEQNGTRYLLTINDYWAKLEGSPLPKEIPGWSISIEDPSRIRLGPPDFPSISAIERLLLTLLPPQSFIEIDSKDEHRVFLTVNKLLAPKKEEIQTWGWNLGVVEASSSTSKMELTNFSSEMKTEIDKLSNIIDRRYNLRPYNPILITSEYKLDRLPSPINTRGKAGSKKHIDGRFRGTIVRASQLTVSSHIKKRKLPAKEGKAPGIYLNYKSHNPSFLTTSYLQCGCYAERDELGRPCRCEQPDERAPARKCGCFG